MIDGRALIFSGHSGRGKSTLATALARLGHTMLSDDITVIRFDEKGAAFAIPGSPHSRLRPDSIKANAIEPGHSRDARHDDDKRVLRRELRHFQPTPVAAVVRLDLAEPGEEPTIRRLNGPNAVLPLDELVYRIPLGRKLGAARHIAHGALRLAAAAPILRLTRSQQLERLEGAVALALASLAVTPR
jgi:energy-coupling factor transporter ATP-binding protein EcfA2